MTPSSSLLFEMPVSPGSIVNLLLDDAVATLPMSDTLGFLFSSPRWPSPFFSRALPSDRAIN